MGEERQKKERENREERERKERERRQKEESLRKERREKEKENKEKKVKEIENTEKEVILLDEDEDVPLAKRRTVRKRKPEPVINIDSPLPELRNSKKPRPETEGNSQEVMTPRRGSQEKEVGWPRVSSLFAGAEEGRRVRKPTAKVQPFVHVEPEKEKKKPKPKEKKTVAVPPKRIHQPPKGPYYAACKVGAYRCPLCYTQWSLNQPYGRHLIGQACQVDPAGGPATSKKKEEEERGTMKFVTVGPATVREDSTLSIGKVPSLKFLSRSASSTPPPSLPMVKEGLEYYHSLYSNVNRNVQKKLFTRLRTKAGLNLIAGLAGYERLCREPLKIAIYLERKISLARDQRIKEREEEREREREKDKELKEKQKERERLREERQKKEKERKGKEGKRKKV